MLTIGSVGRISKECEIYVSDFLVRIYNADDMNIITQTKHHYIYSEVSCYVPQNCRGTVGTWLGYLQKRSGARKRVGGIISNK